MKIGMVGLGRMGGNMVERLRSDGHDIVTYDPKVESTAGSLGELVELLEQPRAVWMMVPAGDVTEQVFRELLELVGEGDTIVDGGNSNFRDSERRAREAGTHGIGFVDAGTSGGVWGLAEGYCLMVGGAREHVQALEPAFRTLAPEDGYAHVGPPGAGHYVKMVHNAIEYGLMQAYGEGFELLRASDYDLDLRQIAGLWRNGSVVRSWLLDLLEHAFEEHGSDLGGIPGYVEDSGEGRWSLHEAIDRAVPVPTIALSLFRRFASRQDESFSAKVEAALRKQFGRHPVKAGVGG